MPQFKMGYRALYSLKDFYCLWLKPLEHSSPYPRRSCQFPHPRLSQHGRWHSHGRKEASMSEPQCVPDSGYNTFMGRRLFNPDNLP